MSQSDTKPINRRKKPKRRSGILIFILILALLTTGAYLCWKYIINNIRPELTIEVGETAVAEDFLIRQLPLPVELETSMDGLDLSVPGDHPIAVRYCWMSHSSILHVRDTVCPTGTLQPLTVLSTRIPVAEDFVTGIQDMTEVTVSYASPPDTTQEGEQSVTIVLTDMGGNTTELSTTLTILFDVTAPEITGVEDKTVYVGHSFDPMEGVTVSDDLDTKPALTLDNSALDLTTEGIYEITYQAMDESGNVTSVTAAITVIHDVQAPTLFGVRPLSVYAESTISYRSNVIVTDDKDPSPLLTIDSSQVDLTTPGTYAVVYKATDAAGNEATMETTVTVGEKPETLIDAELIYAEADQVIAEIITGEMTAREQVEAIYIWALNNCWYTNNTDKTDWLQTAYHMLTRGSGDCFGFYSVTRLLFERLGIPNLTVQRLANPHRRSTHYWSMVSVDGGETYYHFDACPHPEPAYAMCLVTDLTLEWFNSENPYYYYYDKSLYPATPTE